MRCLFDNHHSYCPPLSACVPNNLPAHQLAAVGDFGSRDSNEKNVADMVAAFAPAVDEILALGDNNYDTGSQATIGAL